MVCKGTRRCSTCEGQGTQRGKCRSCRGTQSVKSKRKINQLYEASIDSLKHAVVRSISKKHMKDLNEFYHPYLVKVRSSSSIGVGFLVKRDGKKMLVSSVLNYFKGQNLRFYDYHGKEIKIHSAQRAYNGGYFFASLEKPDNYRYLELPENPDDLANGQDVLLWSCDLSGFHAQSGKTNGVGIKEVEIDSPIGLEHSGSPLISYKTGRCLGVVSRTAGAGGVNWITKDTRFSKARFFASRIGMGGNWHSGNLSLSLASQFVGSYSNLTKHLDEIIREVKKGTFKGSFDSMLLEVQNLEKVEKLPKWMQEVSKYGSLKAMYNQLLEVYASYCEGRDREDVDAYQFYRKKILATKGTQDYYGLNIIRGVVESVEGSTRMVYKLKDCKGLYGRFSDEKTTLYDMKNLDLLPGQTIYYLSFGSSNLYENSTVKVAASSENIYNYDLLLKFERSLFEVFQQSLEDKRHRKGYILVKGPVVVKEGKFYIGPLEPIARRGLATLPNAVEVGSSFRKFEGEVIYFVLYDTSGELKAFNQEFRLLNGDSVLSR